MSLQVPRAPASAVSSMFSGCSEAPRILQLSSGVCSHLPPRSRPHTPPPICPAGSEYPATHLPRPFPSLRPILRLPLRPGLRHVPSAGYRPYPVYQSRMQSRVLSSFFLQGLLSLGRATAPPLPILRSAPFCSPNTSTSSSSSTSRTDSSIFSSPKPSESSS
jgi:hypothetical protein